MQQEQILLPARVTVRASNGNRYMVEGFLGQGESGAVYLVRDRHDRQRLYALKEVINPNKSDGERFTFEGEVLRRLQQRALPRVYDIFEHDKLKRGYLLMDYIKGRNLEHLRQEQPEQCFSLPLVLALLAPIVDALIYLHSQEPPIVHRDIKPANIIVPVGAEEAVLVDFGSAKEYLPDGTMTVTCRRSPGYAAPEHYGGGTSPRTDIYGLGATVYTLLTGTMPTNALSRLARIKGKGSDPLKPANLLKPSLPRTVVEALQRAMSISSADRFETVEEFWKELKALGTQQKVSIPRVTSVDAPYPLPKQDARGTTTISFQEKQDPALSKKHLVVLLILLAVLAAVALGVAFLLHS